MDNEKLFVCIWRVQRMLVLLVQRLKTDSGWGWQTRRNSTLDKLPYAIFYLLTCLQRLMFCIIYSAMLFPHGDLWGSLRQVPAGGDLVTQIQWEHTGKVNWEYRATTKTSIKVAWWIQSAIYFILEWTERKQPHKETLIKVSFFLTPYPPLPPPWPLEGFDAEGTAHSVKPLHCSLVPEVWLWLGGNPLPLRPSDTVYNHKRFGFQWTHTFSHCQGKSGVMLPTVHYILLLITMGQWSWEPLISSHIPGYLQNKVVPTGFLRVGRGGRRGRA